MSARGSAGSGGSRRWWRRRRDRRKAAPERRYASLEASLLEDLASEVVLDLGVTRHGDAGRAPAKHVVGPARSDENEPCRDESPNELASLHAVSTTKSLSKRAPGGGFDLR